MTSLQALTQALTTAVSNRLVASATTTKYSTSIYPYDTTSVDVEKKDGKYQWAVVTNMMNGWKLVIANLENAENMMDIFNNFQTQFVFCPLLVVPADGTGSIRYIPRTIAGENYWDADIANFKNVLVDIHALSLYQV